jgi:hypothetical protein
MDEVFGTRRVGPDRVLEVLAEHTEAGGEGLAHVPAVPGLELPSGGVVVRVEVDGQLRVQSTCQAP